MTGWFQVESPGQIQFKKYGQQDLINIKSLGCDVIRLPINLHSMTSGSPDFLLDHIFLMFLDSVVNWAEDLEIYLILDNHSFDPKVNTSPEIGGILTKAWSQVAAHYQNRSDYLMYEILNEPHGISASMWGVIQGEVIDAIRLVDNQHTIIVGGTNFNKYAELQNIPYYNDENLIYTFHFYDPYIFSNQGATWQNPSLETLAGVPFPYYYLEMPACPDVLKGTWIENEINNYPQEGTVTHVKSLIDIAIDFKNTRKVPVFCGEMGVYMLNCYPSDRVFWYQTVRQYLEDNSIPWTTWDYQGGFGLFNKESHHLIDHDLNVSLLDALGLHVPPQTPFSIQPDTAGSIIYSDYIGSGMMNANYGNGTISYYSSLMPNNGQFCILWEGVSRYNHLGFDFTPDRDLSELVSSNYAIDLIVRGNEPGIKFDARFRDTKTGEDDHPWRMGFTIDDNMVEWDGNWHRVHVDLCRFVELGSWDNNTWYDPEGKFDWTRVDRFEFSTEYPVVSGEKIWFDNICITDQDTARILETQTVGINPQPQLTNPQLHIWPNPFDNHTVISYMLEDVKSVELSIYTLYGRKITCLIQGVQTSGYHSYTWNGIDENGQEITAGIYLCHLLISERSHFYKIIKT